MTEKYKDVRAKDMYVETEGELRVTGDTQFDRLEKKVDRILELLEGQELSTSFEVDFVKTTEKISKQLDERHNKRLRKYGLI